MAFFVGWAVFNFCVFFLWLFLERGQWDDVLQKYKELKADIAQLHQLHPEGLEAVRETLLTCVQSRGFIILEERDDIVVFRFRALIDRDYAPAVFWFVAVVSLGISLLIDRYIVHGGFSETTGVIHEGRPYRPIEMRLSAAENFGV